MVEDGDIKELVRRGYNAVPYHHDAEGSGAWQQTRMTRKLLERLAPASRLLDLGCGSGLPLARDATAAGHRVTGVDISEVAIARATELVPEATFIRADAGTATFEPESFEAIACLYMIFHLEPEEQRQLLATVREWLVPGGLLLVIAGNTPSVGITENWRDSGTSMWWSHPGAETYREWVKEAGFTLVEDEFIPEGSKGHRAYWCRRPVPSA